MDDQQSRKGPDDHGGAGREAPLPSVNRRGFLGLGSSAALAAATGALAAPVILGEGEAQAFLIGPQNGFARRATSFQIRTQVALEQKLVPIPAHLSNFDELIYASKIGSYTKGLPHDPVRGEVLPWAYAKYLHALSSGQQSEIDRIPLGCPDPSMARKLVDPLAGLAFDLEGTDSHQLSIPPAPAFASSQQAAEMVENYWMALLRDVPFADYETSPLALAAAADLTAQPCFEGPRMGGVVTPQTLFRGVFPGDLVGPYVSQFRYLPAPFGATDVDQRIRTALAGVDYVTTFPAWLAIQNGCEPGESTLLDPVRRYIADGRDYGEWVHVDLNDETYLIAFLVLVELGVPFNVGNPYNRSRTQEGFGTFGDWHGAALLAEVTTRALKAVWFQKWFVHRRERPEDFAGRVALDQTGVANYPIHPDLGASEVLERIFDATGSYFLPLAYPEGSPLHPSYGEGHGAVAGACVTILKAFFRGDFIIRDPQVPAPGDPTRLVPYLGPPLTVTGEFDKLASNVALARDFAGVHWRSDALQALLLGEQVAISVLRDQRPTYAEDFCGFTFTRFDGSVITV